MRKKNIIYILADDIGMGMLSCYGQTLFSTPNIDGLAKHGMRFTNFCATAFCAPSRACLLSGQHDAHAGTWTFTPGGYYKKLSTGELTQEALQEVLQHVHVHQHHTYIAQVAKQAGYFTGEIGKLEWGFCTDAKQIMDHGWDYHYGYYDHIQCHGYYPPFLFENGKMVEIQGNTDPHCGRPDYRTVYDQSYQPIHNMEGRAQYSQDLFDQKIEEFITSHKHEPFFLYHPSQLPHGLIFMPQLHPAVANLSELTPIEKEYASMVLRLDETVGKIMTILEKNNLIEDTVILFSSDNGHTLDYQQPGRLSATTTKCGSRNNQKNHPYRSIENGDVFDGNHGMAGLKFSNWNGGCVVPFIASCPNVIPENTVCDCLTSNYDTLATVAEIAGIPAPQETDGISYWSLLTGIRKTSLHQYVVYCSDQGPALVTADLMKLRVYFPIEQMNCWCDDMTNDPRIDFQLYDLKVDMEERHNIAKDNPELVLKLKELLLMECDGNLLNGMPDQHRAFPSVPALSWNEVEQGKI